MCMSSDSTTGIALLSTPYSMFIVQGIRKGRVWDATRTSSEWRQVVGLSWD